MLWLNIKSNFSVEVDPSYIFICYVAECVQLLLAHGAPVKVKNLAGWSPLAEAISYGDRQTSSYKMK